jgi:uncharacterized protein YjlB
MGEIETRIFEPSGGIPNSRFPAVIYRDALPAEAREGRAACALLSANGWGGNWLYGVYPFWHFHTKGHEVLACVAGRARLGLGGEDGIEVEVRQGDVCVLPAGVGHKCLESSGDFQMAGGYPPGQQGNIVRPGEIDESEARRQIAALPLPATDPLSGKADGMVELWRATVD